MACVNTIGANKITHTRGDTLIRQVEFCYQASGETYTPQDGDSVRFALKHTTMTSGNKQYTDQEPLILKAIPIDTMILKLDPEDTKPLDFGTYVYDIQITYSNGDVETPIKESVFVLTPEVD